MTDVADLIQRHGCDATFQNVKAPGKVGRVACTLRGINFFVNFLGNSEKFGSMNFFTVVDDAGKRSWDDINEFNADTRAAKIIRQGNSLCLTFDVLVDPSGLSEETLLNNLKFWEFALGLFGQWCLSEKER